MSRFTLSPRQFSHATVARHPKIWTKVHSISRRPPQEELPSNFKSHAIDLLNSTPEEIAKQLRAGGVDQVDYIFFYVFMPAPSETRLTLWKKAGQVCELNGKIMDQFLQGIVLAGLRPKRVLLQTGGKGKFF